MARVSGSPARAGGVTVAGPRRDRTGFLSFAIHTDVHRMSRPVAAPAAYRSPGLRSGRPRQFPPPDTPLCPGVKSREPGQERAKNVCGTLVLAPQAALVVAPLPSSHAMT